MTDPQPAEDLARLEAVLRSYGPTITAYSGGVDSTLVAVVAARVHGERALAVTGVSASLATSEREQAGALATQLGLRHRLIDTHEIERPGYRQNAGDRCYHCKTELFEQIAALRGALEASGEAGFAIAYGATRDDLGDHRPGLRAARELEVRKPLVEAQLGKPQIRALARALGLPNHLKPAAPCLASRVPAGTRVSPEVLAQIEAAEAGVRALGFSGFRVRHHGELARIELPVAELQRGLERRVELLAAVKRAGYRIVTLDLAGYRSGSLNVLSRSAGD
ncbi:MAG: ATP-dependent sacrificial sulfur transferase LarE [Myxococcales bacterium]|nr:ATP-dependent sacrificial sulfur transferase LarE [Myxococcales bacterium]